jgi:3-oxoacyl-[acyl-carrier-protein] synthase III
MQPLGIYGVGVAGGLGLGLAQVLENLDKPQPPRSERAGVLGCFAQELPLPSLPGSRRFSPWLKMSLAAAREAWGNEAVSAPERLGVVGATAYGSLTHTAAFVENMIRRQEAEPQPANFIYSVHNAASTQVAQALSARGYNLTITHDPTSFEQAVAVASRRLGEEREDRLLVLGADEYHPYAHAAQKRFGLWRRRAGRAYLPGEGAAALLLGPWAAGLPAVAGVHCGVVPAGDSPAAESARLTQALAEAHLTWENISGVLVGTGPGDDFTPAVFSSWQALSGRKITPYFDFTGFFPTATATALALGAAWLSGTQARRGAFFQEFKKNQHRNALLLYNRWLAETRSWVILTL